MSEGNSFASELATSLKRVLPAFAIVLLAVALVYRPCVTGLVPHYFSNVVFDFVVLISFTFFALARLLRCEGVWHIPRVTLLFLLTVIGLGLTRLWSVNVNATDQYLQTWVTALLVYLCVSAFVPRERLFTLLSLCLASALVAMFYGMYQYHLGMDLTRALVAANPEMVEKYGALKGLFMQRLNSQEAFSTFITANVFAGYIVLCMPLLLEPLLQAVRRGERPRAVVAGLLFCFSLYALYLTDSKGGWAVLGEVIVIYSLRASIVYGVITARRAIGIWVALHVLLLISIPMLTAFSSTLASSVNVRLDYWQAGLGMLHDNWLLGSGLNTFGDLYTSYKPVSGWEVQKAHSWIVQMLADCGVVIALLPMLFFGTALRQRPAACDSSETIDTQPGWGLAGLTAVLVVLLSYFFQSEASLMDTGPLGPIRYFWAMVGLVFFAAMVWVFAFIWRGSAWCHLNCAVRCMIVVGMIHALIDIDLFSPTFMVLLTVACGVAVCTGSGRRQTLAVRQPVISQLVSVAVVAVAGLLMVTTILPTVRACGYNADIENATALGRYDVVAKCYDNMIADNPDNALYYRQKHDLLMHLFAQEQKSRRRPKVIAAILADAESAIRAAIKHAPNHAGNYLRLARVLYVSGGTGRNADQIRSAHEQAIKLYPHKPVYYLVYADLLGRMGLRNEMTAMASQADAVNQQVSDCRAKLSADEQRLLESLLSGNGADETSGGPDAVER